MYSAKLFNAVDFPDSFRDLPNSARKRDFQKAKTVLEIDETYSEFLSDVFSTYQNEKNVRQYFDDSKTVPEDLKESHPMAAAALESALMVKNEAVKYLYWLIPRQLKELKTESRRSKKVKKEARSLIDMILDIDKNIFHVLRHSYLHKQYPDREFNQIIEENMEKVLRFTMELVVFHRADGCQYAEDALRLYSAIRYKIKNHQIEDSLIKISYKLPIKKLEESEDIESIMTVYATKYSAKSYRARSMTHTALKKALGLCESKEDFLFVFEKVSDSFRDNLEDRMIVAKKLFDKFSDSKQSARKLKRKLCARSGDIDFTRTSYSISGHPNGTEAVYKQTNFVYSIDNYIDELFEKKSKSITP